VKHRPACLSRARSSSQTAGSSGELLISLEKVAVPSAMDLRQIVLGNRHRHRICAASKSNPHHTQVIALKLKGIAFACIVESAKASALIDCFTSCGWESGLSVQTLRPPIRNVFLYDTGEFLGSARIGTRRHNNLDRGTAAAMRAGEILKPSDLRRLNLEKSTSVYIM
jgi:hypothetical protein